MVEPLPFEWITELKRHIRAIEARRVKLIRGERSGSDRKKALLAEPNGLVRRIDQS
jgi:hypothetical protein